VHQTLLSKVRIGLRSTSLERTERCLPAWRGPRGQKLACADAPGADLPAKVDLPTKVVPEVSYARVAVRARQRCGRLVADVLVPYLLTHTLQLSSLYCLRVSPVAMMLCPCCYGELPPGDGKSSLSGSSKGNP